jgi:hypothetical protein
MSTLNLDDRQTMLVVASANSVEVRDANGQLLGTLIPHHDEPPIEIDIETARELIRRLQLTEADWRTTSEILAKIDRDLAPGERMHPVSPEV